MGFVREPKRAQGVQFSSDVAVKAENASQLVFPRSKSMPYETHRFRRADRVLLTRDFKRAVKSGKRRISEGFVVVIAPRHEATVGESDENRRQLGIMVSRLGVTVSKRVGNAVIRNRVKRCIREWFRHAREGLPAGSEIVVIARRKARDLLSCEIASVLDQMIQREQGRRRAV